MKTGMKLEGGIFDWTLERKSRRRGRKPKSELEKKPIVILYKLRIDRQLLDLIRQAEAAFPAFEATDIIRRCARWINRSTVTERRLAMTSSGYKQEGRLDTTIIVRSCEKTPVECDKFRILLHAFIKKALTMPKPERFVPSQCGIRAVNESDFVSLFTSGQKDTAGMVIINGETEE